MSRPWLNDDVIVVRSRSRSRSPKSKRPRVDKFGRSLPSPRSRSRSRSGSADRKYGADSHNRTRSRSQSSRNRTQVREERDGVRRRRRSRSSSSSSDSSNASTRSRLVASAKPKYLNARLFVANIVSKDITKDELSKHFEKYGNVVDILVHPKNYAFIQYLKEDHAKLAVEGEHLSTLKGWRLDVKMANENRGGRGGAGGRGGRGGGRGGRGGGWGGGDRDRSPRRDRDDLGRRDGPPRDPYDPYGPPGPRGPFPPPPPGEFGLRGDPFFPDPYRRYPPEPWLPPHDDPFRRDPFADPYRDPYRPPAAAVPPVIECEIFLVNSKLRSYGETVQMRVKEHNVIVAISIMPEGRTAVQMTEELTARKGLFAIFINPQNEIHRSLTLNILHGTPQEHRNMPLDDAMTLVGRSFHKYVDGLREKAAAATAKPSTVATPAAIPSRVFLPPSSEVAYLLNLLADNRALTVAELESIIKYLQERRDKLIDAETRPLITDDGYVKSPASFVKETSLLKEATPSKEQTEQSSIQKELTNKILSIFNGAGGNIQGVPPAASTSAAPPPPPGPVSAPSGGTSGANLINFDNPNVQKALDNLIQSSPNLLKNIEPKVSTATSQIGRSTVSSSVTKQGAKGNHKGGHDSRGPPEPPGPPEDFSSYPPGDGGYPPDDGGYPPQEGGYPPHDNQNHGDYHGDYQGGYGPPQDYRGYDMQGPGHNMPGPPGHHMPGPGHNMPPGPGHNMPPGPGHNMPPGPGHNMPPGPGNMGYGMHHGGPQY